MYIDANKKVRISNQAIAHKVQTNEHCLLSELYARVSSKIMKMM